MKINVSHIAKLANLKLTEEEEKKFEKQLSDVLEYIKKLEEVDTNDILPTSQVTGLENIMSDDTTSPSFTQLQALANAKAQSNSMFQVKGIFDQE